MVYQFGFWQAIPTTITLNPDNQIYNLVVASSDELQAWLEEDDVKRKDFVSIDVEPSAFISESFLDWWFDYYKT